MRSLSPISPSEGDIIVAFHGAQFTYFSLVEPPSLPPQRERSLWIEGRERTAQAWPGRGQTEQLVLQLPAVSQLPAGLDIPETTCQRDSPHPTPSSGTLPRWKRPDQPSGCLLSPSSGRPGRAPSPALSLPQSSGSERKFPRRLSCEETL